MICVNCGASEAPIHVRWAMSRETQHGWFCRPCASQLQRHYPVTDFTFADATDER